MAPNPEATRRRLIGAAEALFAERGVEAVSLREITIAAGVRNSTALQYHFGDRHGLLLAVLGKHHHEVELRRHALLDDYEAQRLHELRPLVAALVRPAAAKLDDPDGGRHYLRIVAQLLDQPPAGVADAPASTHLLDSTNRWRTLVAPLLSELAVNRLHRRYTAIRLASVELARRAARHPGRDDRLFTSHLIDLVGAVLAAPLSDETAHLLGAASHQEPAG